MTEPLTQTGCACTNRTFPQMNRQKLLGFAGLMLVSIFAHGSDTENLGISRGHDLLEPKIQYLGVGGWLVHWRGEGLLLAPSFSNPESFMGLPPLRVVANKGRIDKYMPEAKDVTMLLVGHGHYDHLLDVPWVMKMHTPKATLYGSDTVVNMLRSMRFENKTVDDTWTHVDPNRLRTVNTKIVVNGETWTSGYMATVQSCEGRQDASTPGHWIRSTGGHIRAMPIQSMHASHFLGITIADGSYPTELNEVPTSVFKWKQGQSMAWLIDLLDDTQPDDSKAKVEHRIHFQDSAANPPCGFPSPLPENHPVDVEILGVGSWDNVKNYPDEILKLTRPKLVLLGHWENFFGNDPGNENPKPLPHQDVTGMRKAVDRVVKEAGINATVSMPAPLKEVKLP